ncbi:hypothetical protein M5689_009574 [Euphorbia peplus]|nr:hypothetical protein M5689_009574 [Euphorbia peplus]
METRRRGLVSWKSVCKGAYKYSFFTKLIKTPNSHLQERTPNSDSSGKKKKKKKIMSHQHHHHDHHHGRDSPYDDPMLACCCCPCFVVQSIFMGFGRCIYGLCFPFLRCFGFGGHHHHHHHGHHH